MANEFLTAPSMEKYGFSDFTQTTLFRNLYREMFQRCLNMCNEHVFNSNIMRMSGAMFEAFAYLYMAKHYANGSRVLTGDETFEYYQRLNPQVRAIVFPFQTKTLEHISVPDGMRINSADNSVECVYEYTLRRHDNEQYLNEMRKKLRAFKHQVRIYKDQFKNDKVKIIFVVPDQFKLPPDMRNDKDVGLIHLPFRFEEWDKFIDFVVNKYSFPSSNLEQVKAKIHGLPSHDSATLNDVFQNSMANTQKYVWYPPEYS